MTVDERLDQLEPLLSEDLTVLDRHTYQLKQLSTSVSQLTTAVVQQGDNISFLLREQLAMRIKQDAMEGTQNDMNGKLDQIIQLLQKPGK